MRYWIEEFKIFIMIWGLWIGLGVCILVSIWDILAYGFWRGFWHGGVQWKGITLWWAGLALIMSSLHLRGELK